MGNHRDKSASDETISVERLRDIVGREIGVSPWLAVTQDRIDRFADVTGDHQWIHVDPQRAARESPFGSTIAHGFLILSLLPAMAHDVLPVVEGAVMGVNYGFDKVRFIHPVPAGARVRGRFTLTGLEPRDDHRLRVRHAVSVEIEDSAKPAVVCDWLNLIVLGSD